MRRRLAQRPHETTVSAEIAERAETKFIVGTNSTLAGAQFEKVSQNGETYFPGFLRMKLHSGDMAALHDCRERCAMFGDRDGVRSDRRDVAVREVPLRAIRHARHDRRFASDREAVPPDVRDLDLRLDVPAQSNT